jgi:hypothetical protein
MDETQKKEQALNPNSPIKWFVHIDGEEKDTFDVHASILTFLSPDKKTEGVIMVGNTSPHSLIRLLVAATIQVLDRLQRDGKPQLLAALGTLRTCLDMKDPNIPPEKVFKNMLQSLPALSPPNPSSKDN